MSDNKPKILIVDDKPENLVVLEQLLLQLDVQLIKAYSGNEALASTLEHDFMLVILDVQMPGMDGYEVLEIMSWDERTRQIPVIFITANYNDEQHKLKGYQGGAVDYLTKPINDQMLLSKVNVFLELYQQKQHLSQLQARYQSILESVGEGIFGLNVKGEITFANPAVAQLLGWSIEDITGKKIDVLLPKQANTQHLFSWHETKLYQQCSQGDIYKDPDTFLIKKNGQTLPVQYTATPLHDEHRRLTGIVIVFVDITLHKNVQNQLKELAHHDHLTNLPNRLLFEKNFQQSIARCHRHNQSSGLLFCDLDNFKSINDNMGHDVGDLFLQSFAKRLNSCTRENDTVARLGGDEFAVIVDKVGHENDAVIVAEKIFAVLAQPFSIRGHSLQAKVSIGIAGYPGAGMDAHTIMNNADTAMYTAKNQGGNQYCLYQAEMNQDTLNQINVEAELSDALEHQRLYCVYEPRFQSAGESIVSFDISLNWDHPKLGRITAEQFLPMVEDRHIMQKLDKWVLDQACSQLRTWQDNDLPVRRIAFCLSSVEFVEDGFTDFMQALLTKNQLKAHQCEVKLSEDLLAKCNDNQTLLKEIKTLGLSLLLDDFGTGAQSLDLLRDAPVDRIALSKKFIQACPQSARDDAIVHSIIELAHKLDIKILAKCVENDHQWLFLKEQGCDEYFGFYFAKPLKAEEVVNYIKMENALTN